MVVTDIYLVGNPEPFDETVRRLIANLWDNTNTETKTPIFRSPHGKDAAVADLTKAVSANAWMKDINKDLIRFKTSDSVRFPQAQPSGNKFVYMIDTVTIDIFGNFPNRAFLFAREVNRILLENQPNNSVRIKKSNGTQDSAIHQFDRQGIDFTEITEVEASGIVYQLAGELGCVWQRNKS